MIIGLDVGGTHTDVVLLGPDGLINAVKVPTEPADLYNTIFTGLNQVTVDVQMADVDRIVLSTTLTTNAIVQDELDPVGLIVTSGPGLDPALFGPTKHFYRVAGCIDHRGRERHRLNPDEIERVADQLAADGIRYVGVVGKFSTRNPDHELAISDMLGDRFEKVLLGHKLSGHLNFPRRVATTYLNAAVYPIHKRFFTAVQQSLEEKGVSVPIRLLKADGGNMNFNASLNFPIQTIFSGPAASIMGSLAFAPEAEDCLVLDIGGTTTDMAVLVDDIPLLDPQGIEMGGYKTLIRSLKTHSVGIGGDSVVRTTGGVLTIGPNRLGPPMAFGGDMPTPTDAMVWLGLFDKGDRDLAGKGMAAVGEALAMSTDEAAEKVFNQACETILDHARDMIDGINRQPVYTVHELLEGRRIAPTTILVLGGPAPAFAKRLETLSDYKIGVVPRWEVANAIGAALARTTSDVVVFADTDIGSAVAPEENFQQEIDRGFSVEDARRMAFDLLRTKAVARGANPEHLEMELVEEQQFNMVRGFHTTGRNIRVQAQILPGLIHGYDPVAGKLI